MRITGGAILVLLLALAGAAGGAERVVLVGGEASEFDVSPFRVVRPGAAIRVHLANGATRSEPWPATRYFRGTLRGEPDSLVVAAVEPGGRRRGWVFARGSQFLLSGDAAGWVARPAAEAPGASADQCEADRTPELDAPPAAKSSPAVSLAGSPMLAAVVAVETDYELFQVLGSTSAVASHVEDVLAAIATIYRRDLGTDLVLGDLFIWADPGDPFTVESGFSNALNELGDHWHAEHSGVKRTLAHLMSGKTGIAGGIAYHGVLCRADAMVAGGHWGGGYSLTGSHLAFGGFRDIFVTAHELGHNFRAYHTHCFNDLPNGGEPEIDRCSSGEVRNDGHACYAGPLSMPPDGGSILSYCHLIAGGYGNIRLSLGKAGSYGNSSERVIDRMRAHVESVSCLVPADPPLFTDGFESGSTASWSSVP